jgi:hypothetical protein
MAVDGVFRTGAVPNVGPRAIAIPALEAAIRILRLSCWKKSAGRCRSPNTPFVVPRPGRCGRLKQGDRLMRVMVFVKATNESEMGISPTPETTAMFEAMGKFNEELVKAGVMLAGNGLKPSSQGKRIAFDGPARRVIDGPFAETRELVAGYWLWEVKDMDEAVAWVKRCPNPMLGPSEIEIRPLYEDADLQELLAAAGRGNR